VSTIRVSPGSITVPAGGSEVFTGAAYDQFGTLITPQPALSWSVSQHLGTIDVATGVYVAPGFGGTATVQASSGGVRGLSSVTITAPATTTPPTAKGAAATVRYTDAADWNTGFVGEIMITNLASAALDSWTLAFDFACKITVIWGATIVDRIGSHYLLRNEPSSAPLSPLESTSFGFQGKPGRAAAGPRNYVFDGVALPTSRPSPESPRATTHFVISSESRTNFAATLLITNTGAAAIGGWALQFNFAARITSIGGAAIARHAGSRYVLRDVSSDGVIAPGQRVRITLKGDKRKRVSAPTAVLLDGVSAEDTANTR
jgi:cellulase/cellobiase CelA1